MKNMIGFSHPENEKCKIDNWYEAKGVSDAFKLNGKYYIAIYHDNEPYYFETNYYYYKKVLNYVA